MANITLNRNQFVTDTINGFRAMTRRAWRELDFDGVGYTIEYQCSIRAFKIGLKFAEFPTYEAARVGDREGSPSISTGLAFLRIYFYELKKGLNV